mgnify:CR=1 FL=1
MSDENAPAPSPQAPVGGLKNFLTLFPSIMLPMFLATVDSTIVAAALPAIAGDLGDPEQISWVVIAYLIAATVASPVYGRLGDIFGRKRLMAAALVLVMSASILCGLAANATWLVAARVLQGLGGGGLMTLSQALVGETVPPRDRARYQGFLSTVAIFSLGFGAVAGGVLTEHLGWRAIFFVTVPLGVVALFLLRALNARRPDPQPFRFDVTGLILFMIFIVSAMIMFREIQTFTLAIVLPSLALATISAVALALLIWRERRTRHPLFPIAVFRNPTIWRSDALAFFQGGALVALLTFLPIYLRVGLDATSSEIGWLLLPLTVLVPVGSIMTGQSVSFTGRTAIFPTLGLSCAAVLLVGTAVWLPSMSGPQLSLLLGAVGICMGTVMGVVQLTVQVAAGREMLGTAAGSVQFSRTVGAALGTAVVSTVLFATMAAVDPAATDVLATILQEGPEVLTTLPAERAEVIQQEIVGAFRGAFLTMAVFSAGGAVLAGSLPLRRI